MSDRRLLGYVEVDSGTLLVGDPAYVLPRQKTGRPGVDYQAVIDADSSRAVTSLAGQPVMLLQQFGGDGSFPVYGTFDGPELTSVTVEFEGPNQEADGDDADPDAE
jgi:hypothetical protein